MMQRKNRYVVGCYDTVEKVVTIVEQLKEQGCANEDITLITREEYRPKYDKATDTQVTTEESLWEEVKTAFSVETSRGLPDYRTDDDPLYSYQEPLQNGCVVVMVKGTKPDLRDGKKEEESQYMEQPVNGQAMLDATDAMRSNVITSTDGVSDSGLASEQVAESILHSHDPHTKKIQK